MNQIKISAKTVDEAIRNALDELGETLDNVTIDIVEEGTKGLFGLGGKEAVVIVTAKEKEESQIQLAKSFVDGLIDKMGLICETEVSDDEGFIKIIITGSDVGGIIGRRGETLDAVQYLTNLYVNKGKHGETYKRVLIDSENYRAKREATLVRLANSMAAKALKNHRDMMLEPMNPYERRIIHSTLQSNSKIITRSVGEDPNRKIIISPK
ncbi:MAG: protein jag [Firmicutes bacterium]|nr:protein jag [Bacillota bacterium]